LLQSIGAEYVLPGIGARVLRKPYPHNNLTIRESVVTSTGTQASNELGRISKYTSGQVRLALVEIALRRTLTLPRNPRCAIGLARTAARPRSADDRNFHINTFRILAILAVRFNFMYVR
jgi:hypothetical protein